MAKYDEEMLKIYEESIKDLPKKKNPIAIGDIVTVKNSDVIHHIGRGNAHYNPMVFEVSNVTNQTATISPLFQKTRKSPKVHLNHLKRFPCESLLQLVSIIAN